MGIHVIQSQRIEVLLGAYIQLTKQAAAQPLAVLQTQHFITPNAAVEQWLTQKISEQQGISANYFYHQRIRGFQWYAYQRVLEDKDKVRRANSPQLIMKWRIYQALHDYIQADQNPLPETHALFPIIKRIYHSAELLPQGIERQLKKQNMLYWLSEQVAKLFANYMVYRGNCQKNCQPVCHCPSNWLATWGRGEPLNLEQLLNISGLNSADATADPASFQYAQAQELEAWQRYLWQETFQDDFALMQSIDVDFWQIMDDPEQGLSARRLLPQRLVVFTLLDLPPSQLQFLRRLGQHLEVMIFHYNPSQEYWADSVDPNWKKQYDLRVKARYVDKNPQATDAQIAQFFEQFTLNFNAEIRESRHPLLTRFGKQARDHFSILANLSSGEEGQWVDAFVEDFADEHLLGQLQSDMLHLVEPKAGGHVLSPQDQSIQVHVCHSSLRQLEVLRDQLTHWLAQSSAAAPRRLSDILVLVPNLKQIEPLIRSVFPQSSDPDAMHLAVKIAGLTRMDAALAWRSVMGRIVMVQGRFNLDEFADWLYLSATQIRYQLDVAACERILTLLADAGFKRGLDQAHLQRSLTADDQDYRYSLKYALDRLMLGVAIPAHTLFEQTLSYARVDREDFELIGILIEIYQDFAVRRDWLIAHELPKQAAGAGTGGEKGTRIEIGTGHELGAEFWLNQLLDDIAEYEQAGVESLGTVRDIVRKQERMLTLASFYDQDQSWILRKMNLPLHYLLNEIEQALESQMDQAQPTGHITFSQLGQIRPLPYALVVMLNLDGGKFPSRNQGIPFDLIQLLRPQLGDRSRLEDDQAAFLDGLLMAQDSFWLFYNGFDVSDGEVREPSSVVIELMEHLALICAPALQELDSSTSQAQVSLQGLSVPAHLATLYHVHPLQPFDPLGFVHEDAQSSTTPRFQDHWFHVAHQIQRSDAEQQRSPWVNVQYQADAGHLRSIDAQQWIQQVTFPARLYLQQLSIENLKSEDLPALNEPLLLDGLGRYQLRHYLQNHPQNQSENHPQNQSNTDTTATADIRLLQDQLPVGKTQYSVWKMSVLEQQALEARLHHYVPEATALTQRQWQPREALGAVESELNSSAFHSTLTVSATESQTVQGHGLQKPLLPDVQLNIQLPSAQTSLWVSLDASSARAKRRAKVWLEYLLWLAYVDLPEQASRALRRVAIFSDHTIEQSGLSSAQAKLYLKAWFELYAWAQTQPVVLPAALLLSLAEKGKSLTWQVDEDGEQYLVNMDDLLKTWHADAARFMTNFSVEDNEATKLHRDWQFILQSQDSTALLKHACQHFAYALYQPIQQYQQVVED